jgi:hypothetical protein
VDHFQIKSEAVQLRRIAVDQMCACEALEGGTPEARGRDRSDHQGSTLPARQSKWNKIEHRLFCRITQNSRGRPLTDHATIIDLIAATTIKTGVKVEAVLDTTVYEKGIKIRDAGLNIRGDAFHPEWNSLRPPLRDRTPRLMNAGSPPEISTGRHSAPCFLPCGTRPI